MTGDVQVTEISRLYLGRGIKAEPQGENDEQLELSVDLDALGQELDTALAPFQAVRGYVWLPLTSVVAGAPVLVWEAHNSLVPTHVPVQGGELL